jgi:hypothetical protein
MSASLERASAYCGAPYCAWLSETALPIRLSAVTESALQQRTSQRAKSLFEFELGFRAWNGPSRS